MRIQQVQREHVIPTLVGGVELVAFDTEEKDIYLCRNMIVSDFLNAYSTDDSRMIFFFLEED